MAAIFGASGGIGRALVAALAARGVAVIHAGSRGGERMEAGGAEIRPFRFDLTDEDGIARAVAGMADAPPDLTIVATGALHLPGAGEGAGKDAAIGPERSVKALDGAAMATAFRLNTIGPALIAKHVLPAFPRDRRAVFAALAARVGSIGDNRRGGWHSYRASKAALAMLVRNFGIELARTHPHAVVAALHPGTVDTALSAPFQANLPPGQLTRRDEAAKNLLAVIDRLEPADSGGHFDWRGDPIVP